MIKQNEDKYYYFPTMTKKIALVRGEKYVYANIGEMKNKILTLFHFRNNDSSAKLIFYDNDGKLYSFSCWDIGSFISLKEYRKKKLKKLNNEY